MCEYDPGVRSFQCHGDLSLLQWVQPSPVYDDWTIIEYPPRDLRSSVRIGEKGRDRENRRANVGFCSEKNWRLCEEPAMRRIYACGSHQDVLAGVAESADQP